MNVARNFASNGSFLLKTQTNKEVKRVILRILLHQEQKI